MAEPIVFHPRKPCPICKRPSHHKFHPFCSNRCGQVDLNRWLGGNYAIPAVEDDDEDSGRDPD
jgi:uncharacterized protein